MSGNTWKKTKTRQESYWIWRETVDGHCRSGVFSIASSFCVWVLYVCNYLFVFFFPVDSLKPRDPRILHVIEISVSSYINLDINIEGEEGNVIATRLRS